MTDHLDHVRAVALLLPGVREDGDQGETRFAVEGKAFARISDGALHLCAADGQGGVEWTILTLADDMDWTSIEDRIARSWELVAPQELLEAGGR